MTTLLGERWSQLESLARVPLCRLPTPVSLMPTLSEAAGVDVWCKRDDLTATPYGGNKVRKLEYLLGDARRLDARRLITMGGYGSHHALATAVYGRREGFDVELVLFPQPLSPHVTEMLRADLAAGATIHRAPSAAAAIAAMSARAATGRLRGAAPYAIPAGGSSAVGAVGYAEAAAELAVQIERGEIPEPSAIFVAAGSGGTVAGLAVGLAAYGLPTRIVAVRVTHRLAIHRRRLGRMIRELVDHLRAHDPRFPRVAEQALAAIEIDAKQQGPGYGVPTEAGRIAGELGRADGLSLEPTYTEKALAGLLAAAERGDIDGRALFVATLSSAPMAELLRGAPAAPSWAR